MADRPQTASASLSGGRSAGLKGTPYKMSVNVPIAANKRRGK